MSEISKSDQPLWIANTNPFPATAVAILSQPAAEFWSIETEALKQARRQLQHYLHHTARIHQQRGNHHSKGIILAIVGDYGTGKTHIAQDMLRQISVERNPNLHPLYLDAPSDTFLALYRDRFIKKLNRSEVLQRIDDYYADIVADELARSDLTKPVADALRDRKISPDEIVKKFGLMESKFVRELGVKLKRVTERPDFGTALLLLRRPEFHAAVWEWLEGAPPDTILKERGITRQIADDATALEAIGVMAFLFGQQGHRFILFIDEIEKVLSHNAARRPGEAAILALKKLMEVMSQTRALLVLIGLPEFQQFLPEDARQRISCIIRPSAITANEIAQYIREAQRRVTGTDRLEPFNMDTVDYLADIAGGNTRKMVRLCYHAYLAATEAKSTVTRAMLREIAREQFELTSTEDITAELAHHIEARGWLFEKDKVIGTGKTEQRIDYWLPVGENGAGIALFLSRSLLQKEEVQVLSRQAGKVAVKDSSGVKVETVLVINGYLADNLQSDVEKAFGRVIVYRLRNFREDLDSTITGIRVRLEERDRENVLATIKQRVDEIARQHRSIDQQLFEIAHRGVSHRELQAVVSAGLRSVFGQIASNTTPSEVGYPRITEAFDQVERLLNRLGQLDYFFDLFFGFPEAFTLKDNVRPVSRRHREMPISLIMNLNATIGTIQVVKSAVLAFRRGVFNYLSAIDYTSSKLMIDRIEPIVGICRSFDDFSSRIDLHRLVIESASISKLIDSEMESIKIMTPQPLMNQRAIFFNLTEDEVMMMQKELRDLGKKVYDALHYEIRR
jgi:Cdc6-like AAA superfamily ATPase